MLKSLYISNFKGLKEVSIPTVGQLNLIVGKNNSGKSSILEALMLYASGGSEHVLHDISTSHDETSRDRIRFSESQQNNIDNQYSDLDEMLPYEHLFYNRKFKRNESIKIGEIDKINKNLIISYIRSKKSSDDDTRGEAIKLLQQLNILTDEISMSENRSTNLLEIKKGRHRHVIPLNETNYRNRFVDSHDGSKINFKYVPTNITSMDELGILWDQITLTKYEDITIDALKLIEPNISDIRFIIRKESRRQRTAIVRIAGEDSIFPIRSMGDGIGRVLQLVLNMYAARDGIYLIDEFDNGLHYSIQKPLWKMVFQLANQLNIQVFATTHSWDCVQSFSEVSIDVLKEDPSTVGTLLKIGRSKLAAKKGNSIVTTFDGPKLQTITQEMVEVR
ncbi:AAA family ATPase [Pseudocitrobacter faecalis]|uniref:AAA family ATPase n=1 Tax=Pseudocitrobacter faecalis TaxID=1398493 RepID=UPI0033163D71